MSSSVVQAKVRQAKIAINDRIKILFNICDPVEYGLDATGRSCEITRNYLYSMDTPDTQLDAPPIKICFDARMIASSGIGTQIQNVLRILMERPDVRLHLLGNPRDIFRHLPGFSGRITEFKSSIYSIREQLFFSAAGTRRDSAYPAL